MSFKRNCILLLLVTVLVMGLSGCGNVKKFMSGRSDSDSDSAGSGYNIYYINEDETRIKAVAYQFTSTTEDGIIEECISALMDAPLDESYKAAITTPVSLIKYTYDRDSRTLYMYFDGGYNELSYITSMLTQAAIVKTTTQFSGLIDYVSFNIDGSWLADEEGNTLRMNNRSYETELTTTPSNLLSLNTCLYFASDDGTSLTRCETELKYYSPVSVAAVIVDAIIRGPVKEGYKAVVCEDTLVRSIYTEDGLCQVDFNQAFLESVNGQSLELNVYAVVNSLTELDDIDRVKITVDGQTVTDEYLAELESQDEEETEDESVENMADSIDIVNMVEYLTANMDLVFTPE